MVKINELKLHVEIEMIHENNAMDLGKNHIHFSFLKL